MSEEERQVGKVNKEALKRMFRGITDQEIAEFERLSEVERQVQVKKRLLYEATKNELRSLADEDIGVAPVRPRALGTPLLIGGGSPRLVSGGDNDYGPNGDPINTSDLDFTDAGSHIDADFGPGFDLPLPPIPR